MLIKEYYYRDFLCEIHFKEQEPKSYFWGKCEVLSILFPTDNSEYLSFEDMQNGLQKEIDNFLGSPKTWTELTDSLNRGLTQIGYEEYELGKVLVTSDLAEETVKRLVSLFIKANKNDKHLQGLNELEF